MVTYLSNIFDVSLIYNILHTNTKDLAQKSQQYLFMQVSETE
jgi:hypothetical protein